jgi:hypothetical protein
LTPPEISPIILTMIPCIPPIQHYHPSIYAKPIIWFQSRLLGNLRIGNGESVSGGMKVSNFPEHSVIVSVERGWHNRQNNIDKIGLAKVYFVGKMTLHGSYSLTPLNRVLLWRNPDNKTDKIDSISFSPSSSGADNTMSNISEMLTYINYIIKQLNTL